MTQSNLPTRLKTNATDIPSESVRSTELQEISTPPANSPIPKSKNVNKGILGFLIVILLAPILVSAYYMRSQRSDAAEKLVPVESPISMPSPTQSPSASDLPTSSPLTAPIVTKEASNPLPDSSPAVSAGKVCGFFPMYEVAVENGVAQVGIRFKTNLSTEQRELILLGHGAKEVVLAPVIVQAGQQEWYAPVSIPSGTTHISLRDDCNESGRAELVWLE